jgi:AcrR family transcriptional regulator
MPRVGLHADTVVGAAARLADVDGLESVTLARLAAELGVKAPSLYAHVDGLEDLRRRLGGRGARELGDALGRAAAGRAGREALVAIADAYRAYARAHRGSYAALQRARELRQSEDAARAAAAVVEVVVAVLRGYGLEGDDAVHATRVIRAALHGFVLLEETGGFAMKQSIDESFGWLVATLDAGLKAR